MAFGFDSVAPDIPNTPRIKASIFDVSRMMLERRELPFSGHAGKITIRAELLGKGRHFLEVHFLLGALGNGQHIEMSMAVRVETRMKADA